MENVFQIIAKNMHLKKKFKTNMRKLGLHNDVCKKLYLLFSLIWQSRNIFSLIIIINGH